VVRILAGWAIAQTFFLAGTVFFRAPSFQAAVFVWWRMLTGSPHHHLVTTLQMLEVLGIGIGLVSVQLLLTRWKPADILATARSSVVLRPAYVMAMAVLFTYFFAAEAASRSFVYFQF
jgi:hypothetical protein